MTCTFIKSDGEQCQANCVTNSTFCFNHEEKYKDKKAMAVKNGGLAPKKLYLANEEDVVLENAGDAKRFLAKVISSVWRGEIPATPVANTLGFLVRCYLDAIDKAEIETRLDAIESKLEERKT